jgi:4'-phosphopantetheinyl transferase EntD
MMTKNPFPEFVGYAALTPETARGFALSRQESALLGPKAVKKRRDEFLLGRAACNSALKSIGIKNPAPVLKGPSSEPLWPRGIIGALSHCQGMAVCAVCHDDMLKGLGVDIEELAGEMPQDVIKLICTKQEIEWISGELYKMKMIFSAKEAAFKAFFPSVKMYMDFKDAELKWNEKKSVFDARLLKGYEPFEPGFPFEVGSLIDSRYILSYIMLAK